MAIDITGLRFGRLTAMAFHEMRGPHHVWLARCDCGNEIVAFKGNLTRGNTRSCGCFKIEMCTARLHKHGGASRGGFADGYKIWAAMKERCSNPHNKSFPDYGGRGISVC